MGYWDSVEEPAKPEPSVAPGGYWGSVAPGNIDLYGRPDVMTPEGQPGTVRSISMQDDDGQEVLVPTIVGGRVLSDDEAWAEYKRTGAHLGKFPDPASATAYAEKLHNDYEAGKYKSEDPAEAKRQIARERLAALESQGQKTRQVNGKTQAIPYAEANPEHSMLPGLLFPPTAGPTLAAMAYQGTLNPTVNASEAKSAAATTALNAAPLVLGTAAGVGATVATSATGPAAIVGGGLVGAGVAMRVSDLQERALKRLGVWDSLQAAAGEEPGVQQATEYLNQLAAFYPGRPTALAAVIKKVTSGGVVTAAEKKAIQEAAGRAALSSGVGTATQVAGEIRNDQDVTFGGTMEKLVLNFLGNKPGPLGMAGEIAGKAAGGKVASKLSPRAQKAEAKLRAMEPPKPVVPDTPQEIKINMPPADMDALASAFHETEQAARVGMGRLEGTKVAEPETGAPRRVFHGSPEGYEGFDAESVNRGLFNDAGENAFYFAENPDVSAKYANQPHDGQSSPDLLEALAKGVKIHEQRSREADEAYKKTGGVDAMSRKISAASQLKWAKSELESATRSVTKPQIRPVYLNIKNPFQLDAEAKSIKGIIEVLRERSGTTVARFNEKLRMEKLKAPDEPIMGRDIYKALEGMFESRGVDSLHLSREDQAHFSSLGPRAAANEVIRRAGYDGLKHFGLQDGNVWIAFSPDQIVHLPEHAAAHGTPPPRPRPQEMGLQPPPPGAPPAQPAAEPPVQPPLPERWGSRQGAPHLGQTYNRFVELGYDAKKAIIETSAEGTYTQETFAMTALKAAPIMEAMGTTPEAILGTSLRESAAAIHALNALTVRAGAEVEAALQRSAANPSVENLIAQAKARKALRAVAEPADIGRSAMGRGLGINRATLDARGVLKNIDLAEKAALKLQNARGAAAKKRAQKEFDKTKDGIDLEHEREVAEAYKNTPDENKAKFMVQAAGPKQKFMEAYINNLMGIKSMERNFWGGVEMFTMEGGALLGAAVVGRIHSPIKGGEVTFHEVGTRMRSGIETMLGSDSKLAKGIGKLTPKMVQRILPVSHRAENEGSMMWQAIRASYGLGRKGPDGTRRGMPPEVAGPSKFQTGYRDSIGTDPNSKLPVKLYGSAVRAVSTTMQATDSIFRTSAYVQELDGLAIRDAYNRGIPADKIPQHQQAVRDDSLAAKPSMMYLTNKGNKILFTEMATRNAKRVTQSEDHWTVTAFQEFTRHPLLGLLKAVNPFMRISINGLRNAVRYSPLPAVRYGLEAAGVIPVGRKIPFTRLTVAGGEFRQAIEMGGGARDLAIARMGIGTAMAMTVFMKALKGEITGDGPESPTERAMKYHLGWSPYSRVNEDGEHVSTQGFEPASTLVGTVATMAEIVKEKGVTADWRTWSVDAAQELALSFAYNFVAKGTMQGPASLMDSIMGNNEQGQRRFDKFGAQLLANVVTAPIPGGGILKDVALGLDQGTLRDDRTIWDKVKARIPWARSTVLPKRDMVTGEPIQTHWLGEGTIGYTAASMLSPVKMSNLDRTPLGKYITETNFVVGFLPRYKMAGGQKIELTPQEYDRLNAVSGKAFFRAASALVRTSEFVSAGSTERRHELLADKLKAAHKQAWSEVSGPNTRVGRLITDAERKAERSAR